MCPLPDADGLDPPWLIDEPVPGKAAVIDDIVVGLEDAVREPVFAHEPPILFGDTGEGVFRQQLRSQLSELLQTCRVLPFINLITRAIAAFTGITEADLRISSEAQFLFDTCLPVLHPPRFAARRRDDQKQSQHIMHLVGLLARLSATNRYICQWHRPDLSLPSPYPETWPQNGRPISKILAPLGLRCREMERDLVSVAGSENTLLFRDLQSSLW